jgi:hypothetical protein
MNSQGDYEFIENKEFLNSVVALSICEVRIQSFFLNLPLEVLDLILSRVKMAKGIP